MEVVPVHVSEGICSPMTAPPIQFDHQTEVVGNVDPKAAASCLTATRRQPVGALDVAQVDQLQRALRALPDIGQELTQLPTRGVALEICKLCPQSHNGGAAGSDRLGDPMGAALRLEAAQVQNGLLN